MNEQNENEIDEFVIAQADDDEAWEKPIVVSPSLPDSIALLSERAAWGRREKFLENLSNVHHVESDENDTLD